MKISLSQAVHLKRIIQDVISDLEDERTTVAFVEVEKGEEYEKPSKTIEDVNKELNIAREDYRKLTVELMKKNLEANIEWDGELITTIEAIELAKQMRKEVRELKSRFANVKKQESVSNVYFDKTNTYRYAMYDVEKMKKKVRKMERVVNRLSQAIEENNYLTKMKFPPAENYI